MLKNKFNRQTIAFVTIALASIFLYPTVQAGMMIVTWILLSLVLLAALTTLITK
ncbi:MAG: hypothetical protein WBL25_06450 [Anaerolineales bacterium]